MSRTQDRRGARSRRDRDRAAGVYFVRYVDPKTAGKEEPGFWSRLLDQFKNFLVMILIVASVISLLLGDYVEALAIMAIVALNAILGVVQESKACLLYTSDAADE